MQKPLWIGLWKANAPRQFLVGTEPNSNHCPPIFASRRRREFRDVHDHVAVGVGVVDEDAFRAVGGEGVGAERIPVASAGPLIDLVGLARAGVQHLVGLIPICSTRFYDRGGGEIQATPGLGPAFAVVRGGLPPIFPPTCTNVLTQSSTIPFLI